MIKHFEAMLKHDFVGPSVRLYVQMNATDFCFVLSLFSGNEQHSAAMNEVYV